MTFSDKSRYDRIFQQVAHKEGDSEMNYIEIFHNPRALSVSVGNSSSEYQSMYIFLDNHQGGKFTSQTAIHQAELGREENVTDQKYLSIRYLHIDYLNLDRSSDYVRNNEMENLAQKNELFVEVLTIMQRNVLKG